jgi:hypothetical protein
VLLPKPRRIVDERFRRFVKTFACCVCGRRPVDPAHIGPKGIGSKASDYTCIPLCRDHHDAQGSFGLGREHEWAATVGLNIRAVQERLLALYRDRYGAPAAHL